MTDALRISILMDLKELLTTAGIETTLENDDEDLTTISKIPYGSVLPSLVGGYELENPRGRQYGIFRVWCDCCDNLKCGLINHVIDDYFFMMPLMCPTVFDDLIKFLAKCKTVSITKLDR